MLLGKEFNFALYDSKSRSKVFNNIKGIFSQADVALINAEGVISQGGDYFDKGEPTPHMFRAHPNVIGVLEESGIDIVTIGNNHVVDYGREALVEMLDRLTTAGIKYTGGGYNREDAIRPEYITLGDTVIALVGVNFAQTPQAAATVDGAGTFYLASGKNRLDKKTISELKKIERIARSHAHLVFLTPHWGRNWKCAPSDITKKLAKEIITIGYDAILGHGSHCLQGATLIDGKPVLYDAGNLSVYWTTDRKEWNHGAIFELIFNRTGVKEVRGHPILLRKNEVLRAKGKTLKTILAKLVDRSNALGTPLEVKKGITRLRCNPKPLLPKRSLKPYPSRKSAKKIRIAPSKRILDDLPEGIKRLDIYYENGLQLLGVTILPDVLSRRHNAAIITLYWKLKQPIKQRPAVILEARGQGKNGKPRTTNMPHVPGDWVFPMDQWPIEKVILDRFLMFVRLGPKGEANFYAAVEGMTPSSPEHGMFPSPFVPIGKLRYEEKATGVWELLKQRHVQIGITNSHQGNF